MAWQKERQGGACLECWLALQRRRKVQLCKRRHLPPTVAIEDTENGRAMVKVSYHMRILLGAAPPLHRRDAK